VPPNAKLDYPTTVMIATGAYKPEAGYDTLDTSMPSYNVDTDDLMKGPGTLAVPAVVVDSDKTAEQKAAAARARARARAEKRALVEKLKADKRAAKERLRAETEAAQGAARAAKIAKLDDKARAAAEAREAKLAQAEKEGTTGVLDSMKRMYVR
jgi:hypothetical protein